MPSNSDIASDYYDALRNKEVRQPKYLILFSGVVASGKSTVARAIEQSLQAVRVSNDEIRERIVAAEQTIDPRTREQTKFKVGNAVLERLANETSGLVVLDASCDRGYDLYHAWAEKHGYRIILLRMDIPRDIIERRIRERGAQSQEGVNNFLDHLDTWWQQWEIFGKKHTPDMVVKIDTPLASVIEAIKQTIEAAPAIVKVMNQISLVTKCFIIASDKKVLVLKRADTARVRPGKWDLPGGMVDDKENPNLAISREIKEETTIEAGQPRVIFVATELTPAYIITLFYKTDYSGGAIEIGPEHTEYKWIDINEFMDLDLPGKFRQAAAFL